MHGKRTTNHSRLGHLTNQRRVDSQKGGFGEIESFIEKLFRSKKEVMLQSRVFGCMM